MDTRERLKRIKKRAKEEAAAEKLYRKESRDAIVQLRSSRWPFSRPVYFLRCGNRECRRIFQPDDDAFSGRFVHHGVRQYCPHCGTRWAYESLERWYEMYAEEIAREAAGLRK